MWLLLMSFGPLQQMLWGPPLTIPLHVDPRMSISSSGSLLPEEGSLWLLKPTEQAPGASCAGG